MPYPDPDTAKADVTAKISGITTPKGITKQNHAGILENLIDNVFLETNNVRTLSDTDTVDDLDSYPYAFVREDGSPQDLVLGNSSSASSRPTSLVVHLDGRNVIEFPAGSTVRVSEYPPLGTSPSVTTYSETGTYTEGEWVESGGVRYIMRADVSSPGPLDLTPSGNAVPYVKHKFLLQDDGTYDAFSPGTEEVVAFVPVSNDTMVALPSDEQIRILDLPSVDVRGRNDAALDTAAIKAAHEQSRALGNRTAVINIEGALLINENLVFEGPTVIKSDGRTGRIISDTTRPRAIKITSENPDAGNPTDSPDGTLSATVARYTSVIDDAALAAAVQTGDIVTLAGDLDAEAGNRCRIGRSNRVTQKIGDLVTFAKPFDVEIANAKWKSFTPNVGSSISGIRFSDNEGAVTKSWSISLLQCADFYIGHILCDEKVSGIVMETCYDGLIEFVNIPGDRASLADAPNNAPNGQTPTQGILATSGSGNIEVRSSAIAYTLNSVDLSGGNKWPSSFMEAHSNHLGPCNGPVVKAHTGGMYARNNEIYGHKDVGSFNVPTTAELKGSRNRFENNLVHHWQETESAGSYAVHFDDGRYNTATGNTIFTSTTGISADSQIDGQFDSNTVRNNKVYGTGGRGILLTGSTTTQVHGNTIRGCAQGITESGNDATCSVIDNVAWDATTPYSIQSAYFPRSKNLSLPNPDPLQLPLTKPETIQYWAANFEGGNDRAECAAADTPQAPDFSEPFTISFQVAADAPAASRVISWGNRTTNAPFICVNESVGRAAFSARDDANVTQISVFSAATVFDGTPHDVDLVYDGNGKLSFWVDGELDATHTISTSGTYTLDRFGIGAFFRSGIGNYFEGFLADVRLTFDGVLSHRWRMDEGWQGASFTSVGAGSTTFIDSVGDADAALETGHNLDTFWAESPFLIPANRVSPRDLELSSITETASFNFSAKHRNKQVDFDSASAIAGTVPADTFSINTVISLDTFGAGVASVVAGTGVTIDSKDDKLSFDGPAYLRHTTTANTWRLAGQLV